MIQVNSLDEARKMYEAAEDKDPSNPLRAVYAADMRMTQRDFAGACTLYRKAIEFLEAAPQQSMERTLLVIAQDRLSYAYLNLSQLNEAKNVLEADIRTLRTIVSHLETVDPKVRRNLKKSSRSGKHCFNGFPRHFHSVGIRPGKAIFHRVDFALAVGAILLANRDSTDQKPAVHTLIL